MSDDGNDPDDRSNRTRQRKPPPSGKSPRDGGPGEAAHFLREAIADLVHVARRHRLDMLGYLLEMALMEATELVQSETRGQED